LAETRADQLRIAVPRLVFGHTEKLLPIHSGVHRIPQRQAFGVSGAVRLERNDIWCPALRDGDPVGLMEEERLREDPATDLKITSVRRVAPAIACDTGSHLLCRSRTICNAKSFPGQRAWQSIGVREHATTGDHVAGCV